MSGDKYDIGYGRPPAASRFQPGKSGNPKGRPKGARNFQTEIEAELNARVTVTEGGKPKNVSKRQMVAKQLVNKGAQGDVKAINTLLVQERVNQTESPHGSAMLPPMNEADDLVIANIFRRIRAVEEPAQTLDAGDTP